MAFSRKQMVAAVAGTLSLAVLTGCPAAQNPAAVGSASPSVAPTAAPSGTATTDPTTSAAPTTAPTGTATTDPNATTSPSATTSAPAPSGKVVIVSGNIYDEDGATVDDATVTVRSLDASVPYQSTTTSNAGSWVVNNVPEGANVEIVATRDGWTSRRRVGSFQQQATGRRNVINFGAAGGAADNDDEDPTGEAYFISDYPEIVSTTPADEATNVSTGELTVKLTFSEPLTRDSRDNFEDVFHVLPANQEALNFNDTAPLAATSAIDLERGEDSNTADGDLAEDFDLATFEGLNGGYSLGENDTFLGSTSNRLRATWNSEGTEVTFKFNAGLLADNNDAAKYQIALIVDNEDDEIEDEDGNQLGTDADGDLNGYGDEGGLIFNAFKEPDLSADDTVTAAVGGGDADTGESNWASTHDTVANFELAEDDTDPVLQSMDISDEDGDTRIALTFSEPMAAFGGNNVGIIRSSVTNVSNYIFALSQDEGELEDDQLDDTPVAVTYEAADATPADFTNWPGYEREFTFADANTPRPDSGLADGEISVEVDEDEPTVVLFWIGDGEEDNLFDTVDELAVRVENVQDPAGNAIDDDDADDQVQVGSF